MMTRRVVRRLLGRVGLYGLVGLFLAYTLLPVVWMVLSSILVETDFIRLSSDLVELTLDRLASAIHGDASAAGATIIRRLRDAVDRCVPQRPTGAGLGALPEILGTSVTLQYPLTQLEHFLSGLPSDIADASQAELYLSFVRYHLWKLEHLLRESAEASA